MSVTQEYEHLHRLVDRLTPDQLHEVHAHALELVTSGAQGARTEAATEEWPPAWFGAIRSGRDDTAARSEEILRAEFGDR